MKPDTSRPKPNAWPRSHHASTAMLAITMFLNSTICPPQIQSCQHQRDGSIRNVGWLGADRLVLPVGAACLDEAEAELRRDDDATGDHEPAPPRAQPVLWTDWLGIRWEGAGVDQEMLRSRALVMMVLVLDAICARAVAAGQGAREQRVLATERGKRCAP